MRRRVPRVDCSPSFRRPHPVNSLSAAVSRAVGTNVRPVESIAGGHISLATRFVGDDGRDLFVKHNPDAPAGMFAAEADGLRWLAEAGAVRTPTVQGFNDAAPQFIALEWIAPGTPAGDHDEQLGRGLASLHRAGAASFGAVRGNFIATLPQNNASHDDWPSFYGTCRLAPMVRRARDTGRLDTATSDRFERLIGRLHDLCGPPEPPARLHGDLWSGNALVDAQGQPALIDPAVYGGHREMDLAMMRMFGGFSPTVFAAYSEAHPLSEGADERLALCQLFPLLVHVVIFGGGYVNQLAAALRRYVGAS